MDNAPGERLKVGKKHDLTEKNFNIKETNGKKTLKLNNLKYQQV